MSERPVAFRVPRLLGDMVSHYFVTTSEDEARAMADTNQVEYEGLYLVGDRRRGGDAVAHPTRDELAQLVCDALWGKRDLSFRNDEVKEAGFRVVDAILAHIPTLAQSAQVTIVEAAAGLVEEIATKGTHTRWKALANAIAAAQPPAAPDFIRETCVDCGISAPCDEDCPNYIEPPVVHASSCALHNAPALPVGPCDCGAIPAPTAPVGIFASMTPEQQKAALEYDGPENHGEPAAPVETSALVAQGIEQGSSKPEVPGSNPAEGARPSAWICTSRSEAFVTQDRDNVRAFMDRGDGWTVVPLYMRSSLPRSSAGNDIVTKLFKIADASRREDGTDIPLGETLREAATTIGAQSMRLEACDIELAKLRSAVPQTSWQPIETAPRDGTWILTFTLPWAVAPAVLQWDGARWWDDADEPLAGTKCEWQPTHWMPLPASPVSRPDRGSAK